MLAMKPFCRIMEEVPCRRVIFLLKLLLVCFGQAIIGIFWTHLLDITPHWRVQHWANVIHPKHFHGDGWMVGRKFIITNKTIFSTVNTEIELYIFETLPGDYSKLCLLSGMLPVSKGIEYKQFCEINATGCCENKTSMKISACLPVSVYFNRNSTGCVEAHCYGIYWPISDNLYACTCCVDLTTFRSRSPFSVTD